MKTVLVTSAVTFVPNNYDDLILSLASNRNIIGLIVINNKNLKILLQAVALLLTLAAPRLGWQIIKNFFGPSPKNRKNAFEKYDKGIWTVDDINSHESMGLLSSLSPDLILNARTRSFYKKNLLQIPRLGCVNVHHGLLPDQRGLMCDFWAHLYGTSMGFSIHEMTSRLDDGQILHVKEVICRKNNFLDYLKISSRQEVASIREVLETISTQSAIRGSLNSPSENTVYRTNPRLRDFYMLRRRGIRI